MSSIFRQVCLCLQNWMEALNQIYNGSHISISTIEWLLFSVFYFPYQSIKCVNNLLIKWCQLYKYITQYVREDFPDHFVKSMKDICMLISVVGLCYGTWWTSLQTEVSLQKEVAEDKLCNKFFACTWTTKQSILTRAHHFCNPSCRGSVLKLNYTCLPFSI